MMPTKDNDSKLSPNTHFETEQHSGTYDIDQIHRDFYELFTANPNKDMLKYAYQNSAVYDAVTKSPDYYLFREEVELINHHKDILAKYLQSIETVIELGPGAENGLATKTIPILKCAPNLTKYVAVDISQDYLNDVGTYIKSNTKLDVELIQADFTDSIPNIASKNEPRLFMMLGSTIGNFDQFELTTFFRNLYSTMATGDIFILTIDTNLDSSTLIPAYRGIANLKFVLDILTFYGSYNNNFKKYIKCFTTEVQWDSQAKAIFTFLQATTDFSFDIENYGKVIIKSGDKFQIIQSNKFDLKSIKFYIENFNLSVINNINNQRMNMLIVNKTINKSEQNYESIYKDCETSRREGK